MCAACLLPLVPGGKFLLSGTEVFHPACVRASGTEDSLANRLRRQLVEQERRVAEASLSVQKARDAVATIKRELDRRDDRIEDLLTRVGAAENRRATLERLIEEVRQERDQAVRELAAQRAVKPATTGDPQPTEQRDATEIRFSLLELDDLDP